MKITNIFKKKARTIPLEPKTKLQAKQKSIKEFKNGSTPKTSVMEELNIDNIVLRKR